MAECRAQCEQRWVGVCGSVLNECGLCAGKECARLSSCFQSFGREGSVSGCAVCGRDVQAVWEHRWSVCQQCVG